jgi:hypothetical protein
MIYINPTSTLKIKSDNSCCRMTELPQVTLNKAMMTTTTEWVHVRIHRGVCHFMKLWGRSEDGFACRQIMIGSTCDEWAGLDGEVVRARKSSCKVIWRTPVCESPRSYQNLHGATYPAR